MQRIKTAGVTEMGHKALSEKNKHDCRKHTAMTDPNIQNNADCVKLLDKHDWSFRNKTPYPRSVAHCEAGNVENKYLIRYLFL